MPTHSPLPMRHGLSAAWVRTPDRDAVRPAPWPTMGAFLRDKLPSDVDVEGMLSQGRFVDDHGRAWAGDEPYQPHTFVHFHRDLRDEKEVPFQLTVIHQDERIVVVDKPHFLSTIPRGRHVQQSVVVKARTMLGLPHLGPAHRLDRLTAGVLVLTTEPRWRAPYQRMFEDRAASKEYEAIAAFDPAVPMPVRVESHIRKERSAPQAYEVPEAAANAVTDIDLMEQRGNHARYHLKPITGRTHQLRLHLAGLGLPICGDPLYPVVNQRDIDDFSTPLQLLARRLSFLDPVDGSAREFVSTRQLEWPADSCAGGSASAERN